MSNQTRSSEPSTDMASLEIVASTDSNKTYKCGWCKATGIHMDIKGDLDRHYRAGKNMSVCHGYETWKDAPR